MTFDWKKDRGGGFCAGRTFGVLEILGKLFEIASSATERFNEWVKTSICRESSVVSTSSMMYVLERYIL